MFFRKIKGIFALDIDGTVTAETESIPSEVVQFFEDLYQTGWQFVFITGRPFQWGVRSLNVLSFPYALAVQNGALIVDMPSKKILARKYLSQNLLHEMEVVCTKHHTDFIIYTGLENKDLCYYRSDKFAPSALNYIWERKEHLKENWSIIKNFNDLPVKEFASLKFFAKEKEAVLISQDIEKKLGLHAPTIRDPFNEEYFVVQVTHSEANKGSALKTYSQLSHSLYSSIAAGNDFNDLSLLQEATVKVAMSDAPDALLAIAHIIAPPAHQQGIIEGLTKAIDYLAKIGKMNNG
ncbi:HAD-IIB family hydrolase [Candidatus Protochlamydia amoebophila]|uniref:Sucrose phosphatase-like domain-containing protein n=1 Tax=Protochlamydia amoebophila (strain UWE25) TaxID=264201 RepID=Q6MC17_PARUW|nr:HAD family hydrolase [Candidatus Protochlamydia amoebophila]CAF23882.1 unnamed protein product [Candidatus Protochlamydia amoebophila UWE25]